MTYRRTYKKFNFGYYPTPSPAWHYHLEACSEKHLLRLISAMGMGHPDWIETD